MLGCKWCEKLCYVTIFRERVARCVSLRIIWQRILVVENRSFGPFMANCESLYGPKVNLNLSDIRSAKPEELRVPEFRAPYRFKFIENESFVALFK